VAKSKNKKPPAPIMPHGKKRKKAKPGLGPGPHHAGTYKGKK
jgi:hypothetical protein